VSRRESLWRGSEEAAWQEYRRRGYRLVARNWRCRLGELDLVVARGGLVAFCEVKARASPGLGGPHESVTAVKQRKVRALAEAFIGSRGRRAARYRFDVASVMVNSDGRADVHIFEDAFS
jgi:putative endonuclease